MTRRNFTDKIKAAAFERAKGHCEYCGAKLFVGKFHYDHRIPDAMGGEPVLSNCDVLCVACHGGKTKLDVGSVAKVKRVRARHLGIKRPSGFRKAPEGYNPWTRRIET